MYVRLTDDSELAISVNDNFSMVYPAFCLITHEKGSSFPQKWMNG